MSEKTEDLWDELYYTEKQMNCIFYIYNVTGIEFDGFSKKDASKFIKKYLPKAKRECKTNITMKQKSCISFIQNNTMKEFEGKTKSDASKFIKENIENASKRAHTRSCNRIQGESCPSISYRNEWRERTDCTDYGFSINCSDDMWY